MEKSKDGIYAKYIKRILDFVISLVALVVLSPLYLILVIVGAVAMKGNPFFTQLRPGKIDPKTGEEKIFKLLKFRTMTNEKDAEGNLLQDEDRLSEYGKFLRKTSLDEIPQFVNVFIGDMAFVGPRPLLVDYLPLYTADQRCRHSVRPGITGYAQAHGRNAITWEEKFKLDTYYVDHISFEQDAMIVIDTVKAVLRHTGISSKTNATMEKFEGSKPENKIEEKV